MCYTGRMRLGGHTLCALCTLAAALALPWLASATEEQWRLGAEAGYGLIGLSEGTLGGFTGSVHATYGLSDAFNLRAGGDLSYYQRPPPGSYALQWSGTVGFEYVLDVLDWVPYAGLSAGPMGLFKAGERNDYFFGVEIPAGLGYQVLPELLLGGEFRYRMLLTGTDVGPITVMAFLAHAEYVWGD